MVRLGPARQAGVPLGRLRRAMVWSGLVGLGMAWFLAGSVGALPPSPPPDYSNVVFHDVREDFIAEFPLPSREPIERPIVPAPSPNMIVITIMSALPTFAEAKSFVYATLGPTQGACLVDIIHHEDGTWDPHRWSTTGSGAYGIPQALPGSKMAWAGADWRDNRITQIRWMIHYVNGRYGSACSAAAFRNRNGWY